MPQLTPVAKMFGLTLYAGAELTAVEAVAPRSESELPHDITLIGTPNPEQVVLAHENKNFLAALQELDLLLPDGIGLVAASQLLALSPDESRIRDRITGVDFVQKLLVRAAETGSTVLVIGGRALGDSAAHQLHELRAAQVPELRQAQPKFFWHEGYADVAQPSEEEEHTLCTYIKQLRPALVCVAFGAPHQEQWLVEHRELLADAGTQTAIVVGGAFDFLTGSVKRAPVLIQAIGLEWLFRLIQEPWRLRRQLKLLTFCKLVVQEFLNPRVS